MQHWMLDYQISANDDAGLTLTIFRQGQIVPLCFCMEKGKTMDISETIVVYDVKVGRYS